MKENNEKKQLVSNIFSLSILQSANYVLPLISFPYLVRTIGIDNFGLVTFAQAFIMYFNIVVDYGFNLSATREISLYKGDLLKISNTFNSVMVIKLIMFLLSFFIFSIIVFSMVESEKNLQMYLMGFTMVLGQVLFPIWFFQGIEKMKYITYINIYTKIIFLIALFIFIKEPDDYIYVLLINGIGLIVSGLLSLYIVYKEFKLQIRIPNLSELKIQLKKGWHLFIATAFGAMYRNINILILGLFANNTIVGYYAISEKIIKIIQSLQAPIGQAFYPYLSKKFDKIKHFGFHKIYFKYVFALFLTVSFVIYIFSPHIIKLVAGSNLENSILDLKILSIVITIGGLNYYFGVLGLLTMGYQKEFSKMIFWTGLFNIIVVFIFTYFYKDIGASISLVLSEIFLLILLSLFIKNIKCNY